MEKCQETQSIVVHSSFEIGDRVEIMHSIEKIILERLQQLNNNIPQYFWKSNEKIVTIDFKNKKFRNKFSLVSFLLSVVYRLLITDKYATKREIYYENLDLFQSQSEIDGILSNICCLLNVPIWQLRIRGTAKGLVYGPVTFSLKGDIQISADVNGGLLLPDVLQIVSISSNAKYVFLVEKDAAFQTVIQSGSENNMLSNTSIFITGKGYPDVNTRMAVCRLRSELNIPVFAVVDGDPHGIDIMCVYRYGSKVMSKHSKQLACPVIRWIGVHPSDILHLNLESQSTSPDDKVIISSLLSRPCINSNSAIVAQIEVLRDGGKKCEIEALNNFSPTYLIDTYLPSKLRSGEYY